MSRDSIFWECYVTENPELHAVGFEKIPESWRDALGDIFYSKDFLETCKFVEEERIRDDTKIYPKADDVFSWTQYCSPKEVKVVIVGQNPFPNKYACGLAFSVKDKTFIPASTQHIYEALDNDDIKGFEKPPDHGNLEEWAKQGVLLLNAVLTVRKDEPNSHASQGWEKFTDAVIKYISDNCYGVVFLLWENNAQEKRDKIDEMKNDVLEATHPTSPNTENRESLDEFLQCRHFCKANELLINRRKNDERLSEDEKKKINWTLTDSLFWENYVEKHPELHAVGFEKIPESWRDALGDIFDSKNFLKICKFVEKERKREDTKIYPKANEVFSWTQYCSPEEVKVVIVGQDPVPDDRACGTAFSVKYKRDVPASILHIFQALKKDTKIKNFEIPDHGNLEEWAKQGVLLLNAALTVRKDEPTSHEGEGWEEFTDDVIKYISDECYGVVFLLWGNKAQANGVMVDKKKNDVSEAPHPTSRNNEYGDYFDKFLQCQHFSEANELLIKRRKDDERLSDEQKKGIDWTAVMNVGDADDMIIKK